MDNYATDYQQCVDCWRTFHTSQMEYDMDTDEWVCDDCFEERAWVAVELDQDEV